MQNLYYLAFSHFLGIGPVRFGLIKQRFGSAKKGYLAKPDELKEILGVNMTTKFVEFRNKFDPEKKIKELKKKNITVIGCDDEDYPEQLKNISDTPICIYVKGDYKKINFKKDKLIAIVGTRKPTAYGEQVTRKFGYELASAGFVIVSGMALGIDAMAHWAALSASGKTIAVLGCGVDVVYPPSNYRLYQEIIKKDGVIISEFPPGRLVLKGFFVARNRIVSGLSQGVIVIEGTKDSGSLITARYAAEQGRTVFAPPSAITSPMADAPNILIKQGAKLVTSINDILEEFNLKVLPKKEKEIELTLTFDEKKVYQRLKDESKQVDEIIAETGLTVDQVLNTLSIMEIKNIIEKNSEGKYQIKLC